MSHGFRGAFTYHTDHEPVRDLPAATPGRSITASSPPCISPRIPPQPRSSSPQNAERLHSLWTETRVSVTTAIQTRTR